MRRVIKGIIAFLMLVFIASPITANACTIWAAAGSKVDGGGTLIVKNRDWVPDHQQVLKLNIPSQGYRYIELNTVGNTSPGTKAGINEHGLVVVNASTPSIYDKPENFIGRQGTSSVLRNYRSVQEALDALRDGKWSGGPVYLILADAQEIAVIEFGLNGTSRTESTKSGVVYHTNHYLNPDLQSLNPYRSGGSYKRAEHIKIRLASKESFTAQDFIEESKNPTVWHSGATSQSSSTLSTWLVSQSPHGDARLYLRMGNPGQPVKEYDFLIKELFAGNVDLTQVK
ncbi:MAG TPA: C45 family autoproteolytic acyltransferase/hydrolase [Negativicutes bacterium]|nr:C45 family autoproteolytic acyltransferase/hydrolase [Negativicutes bacterium]